MCAMLLQDTATPRLDLPPQCLQSPHDRGRCKPTVICSFRKSALLVEVPRGIAADRDTTVHTVTPTRTASRQMMNGFVEITTFIHSAPKQKSDEWMYLSPFYTHMHGEWLRHAKSTSQYSLAFSLKVRDDWGFQVNPLCHHDITRNRVCF